MLTDDERTYLAWLVNQHLQHFKREKITKDVPLPFLDSEAKYQKFLEAILKKLKTGTD